MKYKAIMAILVAVAIGGLACKSERVHDDYPNDDSSESAGSAEDSEITEYQGIPISPAEPEVEFTEEELRSRLGEESYGVLCEDRTERAYSGDHLENDSDGVYRCAACGQELFSSDTKFDSETGWPSFWSPFDDDAVGTRLDESLGQTRVEVHCARCGGHLGHVFPDGPEPSGHRYCINSAALDFDESGADDGEGGDNADQD